MSDVRPKSPQENRPVPDPTAMTQNLARYHRQMLLPGFGEEGQQRLLASTALVLGCGALGTVIADMLARAGVGHLVIVDRDFIELTNLQRQVLFDEQDVADAIPKAEAAKRKIGRINSQVRVTAIVDDVNHRNIEKYAAGADILVDGVDNFETRYLANDCAVKHGIPYIYGGAVGTVGTAFAILPHTPNGAAPWEQTEGGSRATPCLRCLFEEAPPPGSGATCDTVGVLGPAPSIVANFEVVEALKILSGNFAVVSPTMLSFDLWSNTLKQFKVARAYDDGDCPCCKHRRFDYLNGTLGSGAATLCGRNAVQLRQKRDAEDVDLAEIASRLRPHGEVKVNAFMLRASRMSPAGCTRSSSAPDDPGRACGHGASPFSPDTLSRPWDSLRAIGTARAPATHGFHCRTTPNAADNGWHARCIGGTHEPRRHTRDAETERDEAREVPRMSAFFQDLKYAARRLRRTPVFTLFAVAILTIGIGLNVTVFGIVANPSDVRRSQ
jgi:adenylyltransferase/sulfurtransferase